MQIYQQAIPHLTPELLPPVTKRQIVGRMLNNLLGIYLNSREMEQAVAIQSLMEAL
jgi:regulator of sirC expression with transglutaminase-like and TPR domain